MTDHMTHHYQHGESDAGNPAATPSREKGSWESCGSSKTYENLYIEMHNVLKSVVYVVELTSFGGS